MLWYDGERWNVVLRFVAGLNKSVFSDHSEDIDDTACIRIQCLFEAQAKKIGNSLFEDETFDKLSPSSLDWFAFGYCIANLLTWLTT